MLCAATFDPRAHAGKKQHRSRNVCRCGCTIGTGWRSRKRACQEGVKRAFSLFVYVAFRSHSTNNCCTHKRSALSLTPALLGSLTALRRSSSASASRILTRASSSCRRSASRCECTAESAQRQKTTREVANKQNTAAAPVLQPTHCVPSFRCFFVFPVR